MATDISSQSPGSTQEAQSEKPVRSYAALGAGVLAIGFAPIFVKLADASGDVVGFYRLFIAATVLTIPLAVNWRRGKVRLPRRGLWLGILGGLAFAVDIGVWNQSLRYTTASNATFLGNTAPIWVGLAAWLLLGERLRRTYWIGLAVALGGAVLLVGLDGFDGSQAMIGNLMALGVGLAYAAYQLLTSKVRELVDNLTYMWLFTVTGAVALLIVALVLGSPLGGLSLPSLLALLALALITHVGGWLLINYAYGHLRGTLISVTLLGQPIVATLFAAPILGEIPTVLHVIGGLITVTGIAIVHWSSREA